MTTFDRFDPFERRIGEALEGIAPPRPLDYLDDVYRQTARTSQRPRWSFPERWFNVDNALARPAFFGRVPLRSLLVLAVLLAVIAASVIYFGAQKRLPAPFGPAANGQIAYVSNGDIYVRDTLGGPGRLVIGLDGNQIAPSFSPDGTRLAYATSTDAGDVWFIGNADGTAPIEVARVPPSGNAQGAWAPDSLRIAMVYDVLGVPKLQIVDVAGGSTSVDLGPRQPWDIAWMPPTGERLLVRTEDSQGRMDLLTIRADGTDLRPFGWDRISDFGQQFTLSGPVWSPDGRAIAYNGVDLTRDAAGEPVTHFRVHLVAPDGSDDRAVPGPDDPLIQENWPAYSPDGRWIIVHRWQFKESVPGAQGWIAVAPADGSQPARDIGPRFDNGEDTGILKLWSPDSTRVLLLVQSTGQVFSVDPVSGNAEELPWTSDLPDWQRVAR